MPEKILGKPKDEEKWDKAKQIAAEEGHEDEYDYIMGIYKRMMGLKKSTGVVRVKVRTYPEDKKAQLPLVIGHGAATHEVRCDCGRLLFKSLWKSTDLGIEIKCPKCKQVRKH